MAQNRPECNLRVLRAGISPPSPTRPTPSVWLSRRVTQLRARKACTQREPRAPLPPYTSTRRASPEAAILLPIGSRGTEWQAGTHCRARRYPTRNSSGWPAPTCAPPLKLRPGVETEASRPIRMLPLERVIATCPALRLRYIKPRLQGTCSPAPRPSAPPPSPVSQ